MAESSSPSMAASPTNRGSLLGWVKNLKRPGVMLNDSVNEVSENELATTESKSPSRLLFSVLSSVPHTQAIPFPTLSKDLQPLLSQVLLLQQLDFLRPLLNHKLRSTNNVNRVRSNSNSNQSPSQDGFNLRQHRDSFRQNNPLVDENLKYFGVPLADAIAEGSAKISILGTESSSDGVLQYGRIPIVVAKCGVFLKKNGLSVEGIFRVGGLSKRIKELQIIFSTPPDYGKKLNWDGYTVHDAALVLRRYLNVLPEPLIPLSLYEEFRDPLRARPRIIKYMKYKAENPRKVRSKTLSSPSAETGTSVPENSVAGVSAPSEDSKALVNNSDPAKTSPITPLVDTKDDSKLESKPSELTLKEASEKAESEQAGQKSTKPKSYRKLTRDVYDAIDDYKLLLDHIPELSRQLLFYILDLLAMVQNNSDENLMSSRNLAAIFQPSILLHPNHDMDPEEYALSLSVVEFLIQYAYKLLPNNDEPKSRTSPLPAPPASENPTSKQDDADKLSVHTAGRPHSRSLTNPNGDVDLIGYRNPTKTARGLTLSDAEFASASSDEECGSEIQNLLPKPTAPVHIMHVLGTTVNDNETAPENSSASAPALAAPPITISDASHDVTN